MKDTEFVYIYNSEQGIYYIKNGLVPVDFGTASKGDAYMKFNSSSIIRICKGKQKTCHGYTMKYINLV